MNAFLTNIAQKIGWTQNQAPYPFHGGLVLPTNKRALGDTSDAASKIIDIPAPSTIVLPLSNYQKQLITPSVEIGDSVLRGQLLADGIIAPVSGVVKTIESHETIHPELLSVPCIVIDNDGLDKRYASNINADELRNAFHFSSRESALAMLTQLGLAGLGGAGFPTATKLIATSKQLDTLIINGAECEPEIACDEALMQQHATSIVKGIDYIAELTQCKKCIIAIEDSKPNAINSMQQAIEQQRSPSECLIIPTRYPTGAESPLVECVTGKHIPHNQRPIDHGIICINVGTAEALWQALSNKPLDSRVVSLGGQSMPNPCNARVRFGTSVSFILKHTHNESVIGNSRIRAGGPLSGFDLSNLAVPISAKTNCLLAEPVTQDTDSQACIRCNKCVDVCPAHLLPQQLHWYAMADDINKCDALKLDACIECGCCDLVCPAAIKLTETFRYAKSKAYHSDIQNQKAKDAEQRFSVRELREEQRKAEKARAIELRKQSIKAQAKPSAENIKAALARAKANKRSKKSND